jgi:DNA-binding HxlR family transcriptional regulator
MDMAESHVVSALANKRAEIAGMIARKQQQLGRHLLQPSARSHAPGSTLMRDGVEEALKQLKGRWKLVILFHLFGAEDQR